MATEKTCNLDNMSKSDNNDQSEEENPESKSGPTDTDLDDQKKDRKHNEHLSGSQSGLHEDKDHQNVVENNVNGKEKIDSHQESTYKESNTNGNQGEHENEHSRKLKNNLSKTGKCIEEKKVSTRSESKSRLESFKFFWQQKSPFSQWHISEFTLDGEKFNCAEQYMMYKKAMLFGDIQTAEKILEQEDPRYHKQLGRKVRNFDQRKWDDCCVNIVKCGNMAKFSQNKKLYSIIKETFPKTLVEASPHDRIWGIGLSEHDSRAKNRNLWKGKNLLGQALTEVRDELIRKEKEDPDSFFFSSTSQINDKLKDTIVADNADNDASQDSTSSKQLENKACTIYFQTANDSDNIVASQTTKNDSSDLDSSTIGEQTAPNSPAKCITNQNIISSEDQSTHQCQSQDCKNAGGPESPPKKICENNLNEQAFTDAKKMCKIEAIETKQSEQHDIADQQETSVEQGTKGLSEQPFQENKGDISNNNPVDSSDRHNADDALGNNLKEQTIAVTENKSDIRETNFDENTGKPTEHQTANSDQQVNSVVSEKDTKL